MKLVFLLLLCACTTAPAKPTPQADPQKDARQYYPLAVGNSWTYAESRSGKRERSHPADPRRRCRPRAPPGHGCAVHPALRRLRRPAHVAR